MQDSFNIDKLCNYLRNHKYKVSKNNNALLVTLPSNKKLELFVGCGAEKTCIAIKYKGQTEHMIYLHGDNYLAVTDKLCIELFNVNLQNNLYKNILNILEYLYDNRRTILVNVAYLFEDSGSISKFVVGTTNIENMYKFGQSVSRYNGYPNLDTYGKQIGYVVTILSKDNNLKHVCISTRVANNKLDKYIDKKEAGRTIINIKYNKYFKIDNSICEKDLINILSKL